MSNEQSAIALLLFRVGPVLCCAPANPVQSIIAPPKLTRLPGSNEAQPGIFYHAKHVVNVNELRQRFGVNPADWEQPGRLIITLLDDAFTAYWVDEIIEVIDTPKEGWSKPPTHLPQGVFSQTLLLNEKIYLFAEFGNFENLPDSGYLSQYIHKLASGTSAIEALTEDVKDQQQTQAVTTTDIPIVNGHDDITPTEIEQPPELIETETEAMTEAGKKGQTDTPNLGHLPVEQGIPTTAIDEPEVILTAEVSAAPAQETPPVQDSPDSPVSVNTKEIVTHEALPQAEELAETGPGQETEPAPDMTEHVIHLGSTAEQPASVAAADHADSLDNITEELEEPAEPIIEVKLTPAEKAARLKTGYLKPVPARVPEAEQEPVKPPFPWKNLAAAVVLFITIAGIGIYYSRPASHQTIRPTVNNSKPTSETVQNKNLERTPHETVAQTNPTAKLDTPQDNNDYLAEIETDNKGITIVLHTPENEQALKPQEETSNTKPSKKDEPARPIDTQTRTNKTGKEEIIHIVVKGDTLWAIAEHYVNNPYKYPRLAELSKIKNPDRIYPGNRVRILQRNKHAK